MQSIYIFPFTSQLDLNQHFEQNDRDLSLQVVLVACYSSDLIWADQYD